MDSKSKHRNSKVRIFSDISRQLGLRRLGVVDVGVTYFVPFKQGVPRIVVRHFEGHERQLVNDYAKLVESVANWIAAKGKLAKLVRVEPALEIGQDFYARRDYPYLSTLRSYSFGDLASEPPAELHLMRSMVSNYLSEEKAHNILERVIFRSLIEPANATIFIEKESSFLVLDPAITRDDLKAFGSNCKIG